MSANRIPSHAICRIVIADVVGYSLHMERDDAGMLARLREIRRYLINRS